MGYLLDTNICIYLIKKRPAHIIERFKQIAPGDIAISSVTLFELQYGVEKSQYKQRSEAALSKFIAPLTIIALDRFAAMEAGVIRAELEKRGSPIGAYDLLIAAIARSQGMILVTNNLREFSRIDGLILENWA